VPDAEEVGKDRRVSPDAEELEKHIRGEVFEPLFDKDAWEDAGRAAGPPSPRARALRAMSTRR
jgi:hypothetical protein